MDTDFLTIGQAAELINVHPETLRRWDRDGILKAIKVNDRGDRRYKRNEILEFVENNSQEIEYKDIEYENAFIIWRTKGFVSMPANFGLIAQIIVKINDEYAGFAFAVGGLQLFAEPNKDYRLQEIAIDKIKDFIDKSKINDEEIYTFEYRNHNFIQVLNPEWWDGKYSKTLVKGLRIEAGPTHSNTSANNSWRVILRFISKNNDLWLTNTFGPNHEYFEYYVWVNSNELTRKGLPNSSKGAELLAIEYGIKRFNETADSNSIRDISNITENNAACFEGKCRKNEVLPQKYE